jgi:hypothetical protein
VPAPPRPAAVPSMSQYSVAARAGSADEAASIRAAALQRLLYGFLVMGTPLFAGFF